MLLGYPHISPAIRADQLCAAALSPSPPHSFPPYNLSPAPVLATLTPTPHPLHTHSSLALISHPLVYNRLDTVDAVLVAASSAPSYTFKDNDRAEVYKEEIANCWNLEKRSPAD